MPRRHRSWGAIPVTSLSLKMIWPASGFRWPVMRVKRVVLPAPFGPMMELIDRWGTVRLTPARAWKPSNVLPTLRTSSMAPPRLEATPQRGQGPPDAAREHKEEKDQHGAQD